MIKRLLTTHLHSEQSRPSLMRLTGQTGMRWVFVFNDNERCIMKRLFKIILVCIFIIVINLDAQEWVKVNPIFDPPGTYNTYRGYFVDEKHGWWDVGLAGPGSIWHTLNGGITWSKQLDSNDVGCYDIKFIDTLHGWFVGRVLPNDIYNILITKDGGRNWSKYLTPVITCLTFFDSLNGFAGGDSIYATTDGGIHWEPQKVDSGPRFGIFDIFFSDRKYGWAVGGNAEVSDAGVVLHTVDSGRTWQYSYPANLFGFRVYFKDSLHGCIIGTAYPGIAGVVKTTNDGGKSWFLHYVDVWLKDVVFSGDSTGWVVGEYGFIWHTTDSGLNWTRVESGTTSHLYSIFFFDNGKLGYILGAYSTLLKYDKTAGIKEEQAPKELSLHQNYPNPFNSQTMIEFDLPRREFITIEVYNILGQRIKILIDRVLEAGHYHFNFDASGLSSGIYFYKVNSGRNHLIKKMLLVK